MHRTQPIISWEPVRSELFKHGPAPAGSCHVQCGRLVSPGNPSYTPPENIVPAGLRPPVPNRTRRAYVGPALRSLGPEPQGSGPAAKLALGRTSNPRMLPRREDHAGSRRSWAGAERSPMDGGGTRVHVVDIDGARRRSHEPTAGWLELGLGWPESTHRWTGTPGQAASLDCSGRSKERDACRARLDRVEGRDSRRTGPSRIQDVPLGRMVR